MPPQSPGLPRQIPPPPPGGIDQPFMLRALRLAQRGRGQVEPNPMVGCVIVRNGRVIGEGWHRRFGGPHAEVEALRRCRESPRGADVYVTLEPCCYHGKTPPCTDALIAAGVRRVFAAVRDPNPRVAGGGLRRLRAAGIEVSLGMCGDEARQLNAPFFKLMREGRPWVILKWAQSVDGKIATRNGDAKWISDDEARAHAHRTRAWLDAMLVGVGTVLADDPLLTCRVGRVRRVAKRIILDTRLRTPLSAQLVRAARQVPTWVFCGRDAPLRREKQLAAAGCLVRRFRAGRAGVRLPDVLDALGGEQTSNVLVEGGGRLLGSFVDERLADEAHVYIAPLLIGGRGAVSALAGVGAATVASAVQLTPREPLRRVGACWFLDALFPSSARQAPTPTRRSRR